MARLHYEPLEFLVSAHLTPGEGTRDEDVACLFWALQALVPTAVTVEGASVIASFQRFGPSASVVAWMLVDELGAMPNATVLRVDVRSCDREADDWVALAAPGYEGAA